MEREMQLVSNQYLFMYRFVGESLYTLPWLQRFGLILDFPGFCGHIFKPVSTRLQTPPG
jgi:hypothetical protein